ncbi:MAG: outer membrane beta-barrel protein, partial [Bacteroidota bacterium]
MYSPFFRCLVFIALLGPFDSMAQSQGTSPGSGGRPQIVSTIVQGRVMVKGQSKGLDFASVALLKNTDSSVVTGSLSNGGGYFSLEKVNPGNYLLQVRFLGCRPLDLPIKVTGGGINLEVGNLTLEEDATQLQAVEVTETRQSTVLAIDRKIYTVDKDLTAKGASALEVMRNLPGVTADADGTVRLRNAVPQIFVDGRPSVLTLEQIPAEQIDRIEVITNPSVKFDAGTTGGLLNVIMKKSTTPGYQGSLNAGAGTGRRYNTGMNLNLKEGASAWSASYNWSDFYNPLQNKTLRQNLINGTPVQTFAQTSESQLGRRFQMGRIGWDYTLNQRTTLTTAISIGDGRFRNKDVQPYTWTQKTPSLASDTFLSGQQRNDQTNFWKYGSLQWMLRKTTPRAGEEWTVDLNLNASRNGTAAQFLNLADSIRGGIAFDSLQRQQNNNGSGQNRVITAQYDHIYPMANGKWEWGLRSNLRINSSDLTVKVGLNGGNQEINAQLSNQFEIHDLVNAAYLNRQFMLGPWGIQAGLRLEQTQFDVRLPALGDSSFSYRYPNGQANWGKAIFPGVYLSRKFGPHELQINASRKIGRPGFFQVLPFILFADAQGFRVGNPALAPEFYHLAELNHQFSKGNLSMTNSLFGRYTTQVITEYVYRLPKDSNILVNSYINGQDQSAAGLEHSLRWNLSKQWTIIGNLNAFYTQVNAGPALNNVSRDGWSWTAKSQIAFRPNNRWSLQWNGEYEAPRILPQGITYPAYGMDLSTSLTWNKSWTAVLLLSDVFNTRRFGNTIQSETLFQEFIRRREVRFFRL